MRRFVFCVPAADLKSEPVATSGIHIASRSVVTKHHEFGGTWTSQKLEVLASYLSAYGTALKNQPFKKAYIDAFAGTGSRVARALSDPADTLFPQEASLQDGSARVALRCHPSFDRYIFIERNPVRCQQLELLKSSFPDIAGRIDIRQGDANVSLQALCRRSSRGHRAVLFLDPYGMQVEWATIEAIARTRAIDLWYLFPLGVGLNRLVTRSGAIPRSWRRRIDRLLGTTGWWNVFYSLDSSPDLFGDREQLVKVSQTTIGSYVTSRLRAVFPAVADPGVLRSNRGMPLYLLYFAVGNSSTRAIGAAMRIANATLKDLQ